MVTIAVEWSDPDTAARLAAIHIDLLNSHLQKKAITWVERNAAYLRPTSAPAPNER